MERWEGSKDNWLGQSPLPPSRLSANDRMPGKKLLAGPARIRARCMSEVPRAAPREVLESMLHQVVCHGATRGFRRVTRGRGRQSTRRTPPRSCVHATPWGGSRQRAGEIAEGRRSPPPRRLQAPSHPQFAEVECALRGPLPFVRSSCRAWQTDGEDNSRDRGERDWWGSRRVTRRRPPNEVLLSGRRPASCVPSPMPSATS